MNYKYWRSVADEERNEGAGKEMFEFFSFDKVNILLWSNNTNSDLRLE